MEQGTVQEAFEASLDAANGPTRGGLRENPTTSPAEQPAWCAWSFRIAVHAMKGRHDG
jgi:hypothetical protein